MGLVNQRVLLKYEKESKQVGKSTFHFAWAMDENTEERKRGVTMDVAYKSLEIDKYYLNIMDSPGHRDFVPNMITGAAQADAALLIVDSMKNAFEAGFFSGGQTREHATLALALGVKQLIVVVNKMETSNWSLERFTYIEQQLDSFLKTIGFKGENISYIPVSGLQGDNLTSRGGCDWYTKQSLLELINEFKLPERLVDYPTRFIITDVGQGSINNLNGFVLTGKVEGGVIQEGENYGIQPINQVVKIRSIKSREEKKSEIYAGDSAEILLKGTDDSVNLLIK